MTTPNAGQVSIEETRAGTPVSGYTILGQQVLIQAPDGNVPTTRCSSSSSSTDRLCRLSPTSRCSGTATVIADCTGPPGQAVPDACVSDRTQLGDGDAQLTVLTSAASRWNFGFVEAAPPRLRLRLRPVRLRLLRLLLRLRHRRRRHRLAHRLHRLRRRRRGRRPRRGASCRTSAARRVAQGRRLLTSRRCALGRVTRAYSARMRRGKIISQSRRPGTRLRRGTRVNVVLSRGRRVGGQRFPQRPDTLRRLCGEGGLTRGCIRGCACFCSRSPRVRR